MKVEETGGNTMRQRERERSICFLYIFLFIYRYTKRMKACVRERDGRELTNIQEQDRGTRRLLSVV